MNDESDPDNENALRGIAALVLGAVVLGGALDLYLDAPATWFSVHVVAELSLILVSSVTGLFLWRAWRAAATAHLATVRSLTAVEDDRRAWQQRAELALDGLRTAMHEQFDAWDLTPTERQVALLLLKGAGHKQIAAQINRSASTVRQHAVAVYSKSGQDGRAELAAFFLEGLLDQRDANTNTSAAKHLGGLAGHTPSR